MTIDQIIQVYTKDRNKLTAILDSVWQGDLSLEVAINIIRRINRLDYEFNFVMKRVGIQ